MQDDDNKVSPLLESSTSDTSIVQPSVDVPPESTVFSEWLATTGDTNPEETLSKVAESSLLPANTIPDAETQIVPVNEATPKQLLQELAGVEPTAEENVILETKKSTETGSKKRNEITQENIREWRKMLGLNEKASDLDLNARETERKLAVEEHISKYNIEEIVDGNEKFDFFSSQYEKGWQEVWNSCNSFEKAKRLKTLVILKAQGIENPSQLLRVFELQSIGKPASNNLDSNGKLSKEKDKYYSLGHLKQTLSDLYDQMLKPEKTQFFRSVHHCGTALSRLNEINGVLNIHSLGKSTNSELNDFLSTLGNIPQEDYARAIKQYRKYNLGAVIVKGYLSSFEDNVNLKNHLSFLQQGGFSEQGESTFNNLQKIQQLTNVNIRSLIGDFSVEEIVSQRERFENELLIIEEMIYEAKLKNKEYENPYHSGAGPILQAMNNVDHEGYLSDIAFLIKRGWNIDMFRYYSSFKSNFDYKALYNDVEKAMKVTNRMDEDPTFHDLVWLLKDIKESSPPLTSYDDKLLITLPFSEALSKCDSPSSTLILDFVCDLASKPDLTSTERLQQVWNSITISYKDGIDAKMDGVWYLIRQIDIDKLPSKYQEFCRFVHKLDQNRDITCSNTVLKYLLLNYDEMGSLVAEGKFTEKLFSGVIEFVKNHPLPNNNNDSFELETTAETFLNINNCPDSLKKLISYYEELGASSDPYILRRAIKNNFNHWKEFIVDGELTNELFRMLAKDYPREFIELTSKEQMKAVFGEEEVEAFLSALPKDKLLDLRRNAFLHHPVFDRVSNFLKYIAGKDNDFTMDQREIKVLTAYVERFGLSKTETIYHYFRSAFLYENKLITELPDDIQQSGIVSVDELINQIGKVREVCTSSEPLTNLSSLSTFELQLLKIATGKSTHSHDSGRSSFESIIEDFQRDYSEELSHIPSEYTQKASTVGNIEIRFDPEPILAEYEVLRKEFIDSIENRFESNDISELLHGLVENKITEVRQSLEGSEGKKKEFLDREIERFQSYGNLLNGVNSVDDVMGVMMDMQFGKTEEKIIASIFRKLILRKLYQKHYSEGQIEGLLGLLHGDISPEGILTMVQTAQETIKNHVINLSNNNEEGYWDDKTFARLIAQKKGKKLMENFESYVTPLQKAIDEFEIIQEDTSNTITAIPDRGFIGEMSGYIGNACYTKEYPLLSKYPNMVPYKFVRVNPETKQAELIGSVLIFELKDENDNPVMLVRAFNIPKEDAINVSSYMEEFIDHMVSVGRKRGVKKILVPGDTGAISNYPMTTSHVVNTYTSGKQPITLSEVFKFNEHDLTKNCYVARDLEEENDSENKNFTPIG